MSNYDETMQATLAHRTYAAEVKAPRPLAEPQQLDVIADRLRANLASIRNMSSSVSEIGDRLFGCQDTTCNGLSNGAAPGTVGTLNAICDDLDAALRDLSFNIARVSAI